MRERIAVVGSGIAGLTCAHVLGPHHDVTLFEAAPRLGGHANTVDVVDPTAGTIGVDTGFIVHNDRNYPNLVGLLDELGVATIDTEMSFGVTDRDPDSPTDGFTYRATNPNSMFAQRRNLVRPAMWRMPRDVPRFYKAARALPTTTVRPPIWTTSCRWRSSSTTTTTAASSSTCT
ncbi:MAG: NAD(P)-binding protein [Ilumatobacteraceae bacterium]